MAILVSVTAADTCAVNAAGSVNGTAVNVNKGIRISEGRLPPALFPCVSFQRSGAIADTRGACSAFCGNVAALNGQLADSHIAGANTGCALIICAAVSVSAGCDNRSILNFNLRVAGITAADTRAEPAALRVDCSAVDHDMCGIVSRSLCEISFLLLGTNAASDTGASASAADSGNIAAIDGNQ